MPMKDAAIMPPNTGVETFRRASMAAPVPKHQRREAENEGEGCHHHRPESQPCAFRRRLEQRRAMLATLFGEFDDEDAILGSESDQHNHADLGIEIERQMGDYDSREGAEDADRDMRESTGTGTVQLS